MIVIENLRSLGKRNTVLAFVREGFLGIPFELHEEALGDRPHWGVRHTNKGRRIFAESALLAGRKLEGRSYWRALKRALYAVLEINR